MNPLAIGPYQIGPQFPPFFVAELSGNHRQSLDAALKLVDAAKEAGAHAVKLQTYTQDTLTIDVKDGDFLITDPKSPWANRTLYDLYQEAHTPWEWHKAIFERCAELELLAFSTPFDETAVDFLEQFDLPCYKIGSFEMTHHALIRKAASTGRPLIISTGGAFFHEIADTVAVAREAGCRELILLKCTSAYPATWDAANLRTIQHMGHSFGTLTGLSDHTLGTTVAVTGIALGACVIEKHLTLSRAEGGVDAAFSMEPKEFKQLTTEGMHAWQALGFVRYSPTEQEKRALQYFRRSLYFVNDLPKDALIKPEDVRVIRPSKGLPPKEYAHIIGLKVSKDVKRGEAVKWESVHHG